jgi:type II secretory pathway component PulK
MRVRRRPDSRGGALLAVLWLTAALSAIVFTVALTARGEVERAGSALDGAQAYYLAEGAIERFQMHLRWPQAEGESPVYRRGQRRVRWDYATGVVDLEVVDDTGKLSIYAPPETLLQLLVLLGVAPDRAGLLAGGIAARRDAPRNADSGSSFSGAGASLVQLEDLLTVPGMTPDIFYGWWERDAEGRLRERGGLARHVTLGRYSAINVNAASPEVLRAAGTPEGLVAELLARREERPLDFAEVSEAAAALPSGLRLTAGNSGLLSVRATAQLKRRPVRRTVSAVVRLARNPAEPPVGVLRWYQTGY